MCQRRAHAHPPSRHSGSRLCYFYIPPRIAYLLFPVAELCCRALLQKLCFFLSRELKADCAVHAARFASGQRGCPNREHVHFSMDTCRHPATPRDTLRHLATRRPAATAARQTATAARQTATAARPTRDGGATDRDPTATSWQHPATSWRHARHFDDRYLDTHRRGGWSRSV